MKHSPLVASLMGAELTRNLYECSRVQWNHSTVHRLDKIQKQCSLKLYVRSFHPAYLALHREIGSVYHRFYDS